MTDFSLASLFKDASHLLKAFDIGHSILGPHIDGIEVTQSTQVFLRTPASH